MKGFLRIAEPLFDGLLAYFLVRYTHMWLTTEGAWLYFSATLGGLFYCVHWAFFPWKCVCGHRHWNYHRMIHHVEMKHVHKD